MSRPGIPVRSGLGEGMMVYDWHEPAYVTRARREAYERRLHRVLMARACLWTLVGLLVGLLVVAWVGMALGWVP